MYRSVRPVIIDLNSNKLQHYPFMVGLDMCNGICNTIDNFSSRTCVPNKTGGTNVNAFNIITIINESKTLTKNISCYCKYEFVGSNFNLNQMSHGDISVDASANIQ